MVDVGAESRCSDAGVFGNSELKARLEGNTLSVPPLSKVGQYELPFVLIGDEAYPLSPYLMRPYPRRSQLDLKKRFTITVKAEQEELLKVLSTTLCLHNFIISKELVKHSRDRRYFNCTDNDKQQPSLAIQSIIKQANNVSSSNLSRVYRERFANYFMKEGAVNWQWEKAQTMISKF